MSSVSVIIPAYNVQSYIGETLRSVLTQNFSHLEVIVVDDGSTDKTADIVRQHAGTRLIQTANRGQSAARNAGTDVASGEFIQYLDADDLLAPDKLALQVEALQRTGADVAYGDWLRFQDGTAGFPPQGDLVQQRISSPAPDLLGPCWSPLAAYLFRQSLIRRMPGWSADASPIDDVSFLLESALAGARFVHCDGLMACYRDRTGSLSKQDPVRFARGCFANAERMLAWWQAQGGRDEGLRVALVKACGWVARACYERDRETFERAFAALETLEPGYPPEEPAGLKLMSRLLGYQRGEAVALLYRRVKRTLLR